jgi:hypothetical protein
MKIRLYIYNNKTHRSPDDALNASFGALTVAGRCDMASRTEGGARMGLGLRWVGVGVKKA